MRIPKIIRAMEYIDDRHLTEAMEYHGRKIQWLKYGALAACIMLVVAVAAFAIRDSRIPVRPDPDVTSPTVTTPPDETDLPDDSSTTTPPDPDPSPSFVSDMPAPFSSGGEGTGGDENNGFYMIIDYKLGEMDGSLWDIVGWDTAMEWYMEKTAYYGEYTAVDEAANIYSFKKYFDVPDDVIRDYLVGIRRGDMYDFTDEEIDLILSDDPEAIAEYFGWENAIRKGKNLYSLNWIYLHPIEDYIAAGITPEDIEAVLPYYQQYRLSPNAAYAFEQKLSEYIVQVDHETFMYTDGTVIYNKDLPVVRKEFVIVGIDEGESDAIYLVGNNRVDGDDNIYAALYMWDQGIAVGFDRLESWRPYQAYLSQHGRSDYYKEPIDMPLVGSVVQIVWDGLCESEGYPKRLTWISRLQFVYRESVYSESEIAEFAARLDGNHLSISAFEDEMFLNNPGYEAIGNGYDLLGYLGYYYPDSTYDGYYAKLQFARHLTDNADIAEDMSNYIVGLPGVYGGNWYLCDYDLTEDETYLFAEFAKYSEDPSSEYYEEYDLSHALDPEAVSKGVTIYELVPPYAYLNNFPNNYTMLRYREPVERDGKTFYGELYMFPMAIALPEDEGEMVAAIDEPVYEVPADDPPEPPEEVYPE